MSDSTNAFFRRARVNKARDQVMHDFLRNPLAPGFEEALDAAVKAAHRRADLDQQILALADAIAQRREFSRLKTRHLVNA